MGKRSFALLLALVLTATLFSACTKGIHRPNRDHRKGTNHLCYGQ